MYSIEGEFIPKIEQDGVSIGWELSSPFGDMSNSWFPVKWFDMQRFIQFAHECNKLIAENYTRVPKVWLDAFKDE
jgi:hypothetical protein